MPWRRMDGSHPWHDGIKMIKSCGDTYTVNHYERKTPLIMEKDKWVEGYSESPGDALVYFSRREVIRKAAELEKRGIKCSTVYGALPYEVRRNEVDRFVGGETDVIVATDAIGMGLNIPIKRVIFMRNVKYDGIRERPINAKEIKQIAGRAGREGMYSEGFWNSPSGWSFPSKKDSIKKELDSHVPNIKKVVIGFPRTLIQILRSIIR